MSDHTKNKASNGGQHDGLEGDLPLTSRAYKNTEMDLPSGAMDDAIRAAARRALKSQPHAIHKSWIARWSTPLSAAALVVLSVTVGLIAIDEQPDLAPASLKEVTGPKAAAPPATTPVPLIAPESAASAAVIASDLPQPAHMAEKKARLDLRSVAPSDPVAASAKPELEERRNETDGAVSGNLVAKDSDRAVKNPAVALFVPAPPIAAVAAPAPSIVAGNAVIAPTVYAVPATPAASAAPPTLADKATEPPDVWMKRILELKRLERTREFEEELTKFRKRYPGFALPTELKAPR